jgi:hypothetical protein
MLAPDVQLAFAQPIAGRGVNVVDPGVKRALYGGHGLRAGHLHGGIDDAPGSQSQARHVQARLSDLCSLKGIHRLAPFLANICQVLET